MNEDVVADWIDDNAKASRVMLIIGKRNSGKTCLGYYLLDIHREYNRKCYVYKFQNPNILPDWIENITDLGNAKNGGVVLIDESGIEFNQFSFNSKNTKAVADLIKVARHKDISLIFVTQHGGILSKDVRRLIDVYLLKAPNLNQRFDEIRIIKQLYLTCFSEFIAMKSLEKRGFFISDLGVMAEFEKPDWFTNAISKSYGGEIKLPNINKIMEKKKEKKQ